jgi:hypothetical protein
MSKKVGFALIGILVLAALFLFPTMSFAAHGSVQKSQLSVPTSPGTATFSALVTQGLDTGTVYTGGLSITIYIPGGSVYPYEGTYSDVNGTQMAVSGRFVQTSPSNINQYLTFYGENGAILMKAFSPTVYTLHSGFVEYAAKFMLYNGKSNNDKKIGSGIWSELFQNPSDKLAGYAFRAHYTGGPDFGKTLIAAISLHLDAMNGFLTFVDGTLVRVKVSYPSSGTIQISFNLSGGKVIATGTTTKNGYAGTFTGPSAGDSGTWNGIYFSLA